MPDQTVPSIQFASETHGLTIDVSVVIPTRNRADLLGRAVRSALDQVGVNVEVIVVLDGEDAETRKAVESFADPRVRLLALAESVGGAEARNVGARAARGRYIALLDDDDEWLPGKLSKQIQMADSSKTRTFVVVTQYLYRADGHKDEIWPRYLPEAGDSLADFLFGSRGGFQTSTYLCPRELMVAQPFTRGLKKHQDWDWFLKLTALDGFELLIVPEPLSIYWVPLRLRAGVSAKLDWRFSAGWAKARLPLMTRTAYSTFLVKMCLRAAMIQNEGWEALALLWKELFFVGRPSASTVGDLMVTLLLPESRRLQVRYALLKFKGA